MHALGSRLPAMPAHAGQAGLMVGYAASIFPEIEEASVVLCW